MNRGFSWVITIVLLSVAVNPVALRAQDNADEAAIRKLVEQFFDAYQKKDLDGVMACWSTNSPLFADFKQFAQNNFAVSEETQFLNVTLTRWKIETNQAFVRLRFDRKWRSASTKQFAQQTSILDVQLVREGNNWKFWQQPNAVIQFARRLEAAKTKEERAKLVKDEKELVTEALLSVLTVSSIEQAREGEIDYALKLNAISFEIADALGGAHAKGQCYWVRAGIFYSQSKYREALEDYQRALQLHQEAKNRRREAVTLKNIGELYQLTYRYAEALTQFEASLKVMREIGDRAGEAEAEIHRSMGIIYRSTSKYAQSLNQFEESLKIAREIGDRAGEAEILKNIGIVYTATGKYAEALTQLEASLKIAQEMDDEAEVASTRNNIGNVYYSTGKYAEALAQHEASLKIHRELSNKAGEAYALNNIGNAYNSTGKYAEALSQFEASLRITREIGDKEMEAVTLNNIGIVYALTGKYAEALAQHEASLKIRREIGDKAGEATSLGEIGIVHMFTGRYAEALTQFEADLRISREVGNKVGEAAVLGNFGIVYTSTGKYAEALTQLEASLKIAQEMDDKAKVATMRNNIGNVYYSTGKYAEALSQFEESLKITREIGDEAVEASVLGNIGMVYLSLGEYTEALSQYEASLKAKREIGDRPGEATTRNNIGIVYRLTGKYAEALVQHEASLKIARELGDKLGEAQSLTYIAEVYRTQKLWQQAADSYQKAIPLIELVRTQTKEPSLQTSFFAQYTSPYYGLIESLLELGLSRDEIFGVSERAKARTLVELMTGAKIDILKSMTAAERQKEQELKTNFIAASAQLNAPYSGPNPERRLEELKQQRDKARDDYAEFRVKLFIAHPELQAQRASFNPLPLAQLSKPLFAKNPNLCLLSYLVGDGKSFLLVITSGKNTDAPVNLNVYTLKADQNRELTADELKGRLHVFRQRLAHESGPYKELARELYDSLLAPAKKELKGRSHVIIIPDGVLHTLPFQALLDEQDKHFIESHTISYAPSVSALIEMMKLSDEKKKSNDSAQMLFAMGRSAFPDQVKYNSKKLPRAEAQVESIARLFGVAPLTGAEATEARAVSEMGMARYVHFATHGELNEVAPMESAILLGKGANDDGMLYARELVDMKLQAELVVLSACETGLGQSVGGEGIMGLTWALFVAGTPTSVVTQWEVRDDSMNQLMLEFYRQLRLSGSNGRPAITKAEALRRAQRSLMKSEVFKHPYHWAPVTLVGDWRS